MCGFLKDMNKPGILLGKNSKSGKRTLGIRDREILWKRANHKCQNCHNEIDFTAMEAGHKNIAAAKGGTITLKTAVCLCHECNKLQRTDSWGTYQKKQCKA